MGKNDKDLDHSTDFQTNLAMYPYANDECLLSSLFAEVVHNARRWGIE